VLPHDNSSPCTAACTRSLLTHFNWELFDHRPYSPDVVPTDHYLCNCRKNGLRWHRFDSIEESIEGVKLGWAAGARYFDTGVQKLISPHGKCLSYGDDCVEKYLRNVRILNVIFVIACFVNNSPEDAFRIAFVYLSTLYCRYSRMRLYMTYFP
jgi:hypothetical protein